MKPLPDQDSINTHSAIDILGDEAVVAILTSHTQALKQAARDPEPPSALAAVVELYIQLLASAVCFAYPQEMRAAAVRMASATLRGIVIEESKNVDSIWRKK